jgi:tetratricopeptide (TPR) repeat protein
VNDTYIRIYSIGLQGDCYSELKKYDTAMEKYLEAADEEDNEFTTPMYLLKAGLCAEKRKDYVAATTYYTRILDDYPAYGSQKTIEKYIARTSTIKKK